MTTESDRIWSRSIDLESKALKGELTDDDIKEYATINGISVDDAKWRFEQIIDRGDYGNMVINEGDPCDF